MTLDEIYEKEYKEIEEDKLEEDDPLFLESLYRESLNAERDYIRSQIVTWTFDNEEN